jgi:DNA modification methylase
MDIETSRIVESLRSHKLVDGLTHNSYSYPARFSPELAKEIIVNFSNAGDWIFDPFMGGGTSVVESLALGRRALGIDINSLAWFVTLSKTTPLSANDVIQLQEWSSSIQFSKSNDLPSLEIEELRRHFPKRFLHFLDNLLESTQVLESQNAKRLARFAMLRVYQSALSERNNYPSVAVIRRKLNLELNKMISGLDRFLAACKESGITKGDIVSNRRLINRSSIGIEVDGRIRDLINQPRLIFTSPPYPGVHVLYNKWQIASRKETYLPYYISGMNDSQPEAYYTFGGRSKSGMSQYFDLLSQSFLSVSKVAHPKAIIAQLVGFSDTRIQLPLYLKAMNEAGYKEIYPLSSGGKRVWRDVPNRKWYTNGRDMWDASKEVLLFHALGSK